MKNEIPAASVAYDVRNIVSIARRKSLRSILIIALSVALFALSILAIVLYSSYIAVFLIGAVLVCLSAFACGRELKKMNSTDFSSAYGEIVDVHKEVVFVRHIASRGLYLFGPRRYDTYRHTEIRLTVYIRENDDDVYYYYLRGVTEEQAEYYESRGTAMHLLGTRFPVRLEDKSGKWLCPICGEFNPDGEKLCRWCKSRILKG